MYYVYLIEKDKIFINKVRSHSGLVRRFLKTAVVVYDAIVGLNPTLTAKFYFL